MIVPIALQLSVGGKDLTDSTIGDMELVEGVSRGVIKLPIVVCDICVPFNCIYRDIGLLLLLDPSDRRKKMGKLRNEREKRINVDGRSRGVMMAEAGGDPFEYSISDYFNPRVAKMI
jgi:hypothetical protein